MISGNMEVYLKIIHKKTYYIVDNEEGSGREVLEKTIGQYTGLKDKNGKEIYEGDIVKRHEHFVESEHCHVMSSIGQIKFLDGSFGFYKEKGNMYLFNSLHDELEYEELNHYEIIGNIYDNPDLLEKGVEE